MAIRMISRLQRQLDPHTVSTSGDGDHLDGSGLLLRVRAPHASWVYRFTAPSGKRREMGLGVCDRSDFGCIARSLDKARSAAEMARGLLKQGFDPIDRRNDIKAECRAQASQSQQAAAKRKHWTLARCARQYHEQFIEPKRSAKHAAQWIASLENHIPDSIWHSPIHRITAPCLWAAISSIRPLETARNVGGLSETMRRLQQRLKVVFTDAIFRDVCTDNPAEGLAQRLNELDNPRKRSHLRALHYSHVPGLASRLRSTPGVASASLEFAILTAARTSEVLLAEWSEFDIEGKTWTIPPSRTKSRREHTVHLSKQALEVLRIQKDTHTRIVFPSSMKPNSPQSNMAMLDLLDKIGQRESTTVHGLCRATFSTWANETDVARPEVIEAALAHTVPFMAGAYNRATYRAERVVLLDKWGAYVGGGTA